MAKQRINEPMLELFIFETTQLIGQLEQILISSEKNASFTTEQINETFRIMHTIKGSSAMMLFNNIAALAHALEDLFFFLREEKPQGVNFSEILDLVFDGLDFINVELIKITNGDEADGEALRLIEQLHAFLVSIKGEQTDIENSRKESKLPSTQQFYISKDRQADLEIQYGYFFQATIHFEEDCGMENLRAFGVVNELEGQLEEFYHLPLDIDEDESIQEIQAEGFRLFIKTNHTYEEVRDLLRQTIFLKELTLNVIEDPETAFRPFTNGLSAAVLLENGPLKSPVPRDQGEKETDKGSSALNTQNHQSIINVSVAKLDKLMDLVGEMVIAEAMVTQNPDLIGLDLQNFQKAARQLNKITTELQDIVMSVRMVPLAATFQKMNRTVRDMCKKLNKEVSLKLIGEETEVDKNIIEHIADPLMHLIRNSIDHGIEEPGYREAKGKPRTGTIVLEAKNAGSDVLVLIRDDGQGFNKEKILAKALGNGLLHKNSEELSDKEIYNLIFLPGFSTNETVTEFSGRGVGMDVVSSNISAVGGTVAVNSIPGEGTAISLKIPLTLAIIDGMNVKVGNARYTIPIISIKESFKPKLSDIIVDPDQREMLMVRGQCYPVLRLHEFYRVKTEVTELTEGMIIIVEQEGKTLCLFADELLGQQQVVVKALPAYIKNLKTIPGLAGCTLLGDGSISLILDITGLLSA
ncbi:chemotaxis protein histidine kinase-like protein [Desulfosporosinus acidiphilus SJ4]|uniref:Chemotaxis protein CheA n=1 Tax=Desulfosporosinus acidiphilus (strain DSM 22704 / JCM 16185 / SJ4) TaxID=646529 RepID=I4D268_DESAJ|nr:chemotaxis protein CheA [Desulfosporosinus acidiphilus]AFM39892.1 chemotaxis protein histidine kinase-like protein [Desulfosporosinus acidiphilus SJ4]